MEKWFPLETRLPTSRALRGTKVHHESVIDWREKVRYAYLCPCNLILAFDCLFISVWLWTLYSFSLLKQDGWNSKYFYALDKCCNLKNSGQLWWKTWWKMGFEELEAIFDGKVWFWARKRSIYSDLRLNNKKFVVGIQDYLTW